MAIVTLDNQTAPTTPASGKSTAWVDSTTKKGVQTDDAGHHFGTLSRNWSSASQGAGFAADTYVANSGLLIPSFGMQAGQVYRWFVSWSKTAAGTAAPVLIFRIGSTQTVVDTARATCTGQAGTAAVSGGVMLATLFVRSVSASGLLVGSFGFASGILGPGGGIDNVAAGFDNSALGGQFVGLSLNAGLSAAWTLSSVHAELIG